MRVHVYPADRFGCGHHRLIWPAEELKRQGHDVRIMMPGDRQLTLDVDALTHEVKDFRTPKCDVIVFQRTAHRYIVNAIDALRARDIAVVIDVDDNLNEIHPRNPAWRMLHPANEGRLMDNGQIHLQSWRHLQRACAKATLVTLSTPALIPVYGGGHGRVLQNVLADCYYEYEREDNATIGWPASLPSHPTDPSVVGDAVARLVNEGESFRVIGDSAKVGRAFKLSHDPLGATALDVYDWPAVVATLGIGITPAISSVFNLSKSWLKPLELSALGVPWVASPIVEYESLHQLGAGEIARTPDEWYRALRALVDSEALRKERTEAGYHVAESLRLRHHAWRWWEAWSDALERQRGRRA